MVNTLGMTLMLIRPGSFDMGSGEEDQKWAIAHGGHSGWVENEGQPVRVKLTRSYWIGATEVTMGQFRQFVDEAHYRCQAERGNAPLIWNTTQQGWEKKKGRSWAKPGFRQTSDHPVTCMTWFDASAFCEWLTDRERELGFISTNQLYRLPTEAEWEFACRGNQHSRYAWDGPFEQAQDYANVVDSTPLPDGSIWKGPHYPWKDGHAFTAPVASFKPTRNRLYDMHGNVWEWCQNFFYRYPDSKQIDPMGPTNGTKRMLRGGSWDNNAGSFRATIRRDAFPLFSADTTGFRVVLTDIR